MRALLLAAALALAACSGPSNVKPEQVVGKWKSSRTTTPLVLHENGDWEIRGEDRVLQYGVYQLQGDRILWSIKLDGRVQHDENRFVSMKPGRFELRERDGSVTLFEKLD